MVSDPDTRCSFLSFSSSLSFSLRILLIALVNEKDSTRRFDCSFARAILRSIYSHRTVRSFDRLWTLMNDGTSAHRRLIIDVGRSRESQRTVKFSVHSSFPRCVIIVAGTCHVRHTDVTGSRKRCRLAGTLSSRFTENRLHLTVFLRFSRRTARNAAQTRHDTIKRSDDPVKIDPLKSYADRTPLLVKLWFEIRD